MKVCFLIFFLFLLILLENNDGFGFFLDMQLILIIFWIFFGLFIYVLLFDSSVCFGWIWKDVFCWEKIVALNPRSRISIYYCWEFRVSFIWQWSLMFSPFFPALYKVNIFPFLGFESAEVCVEFGFAKWQRTAEKGFEDGLNSFWYDPNFTVSLPDPHAF